MRFRRVTVTLAALAVSLVPMASSHAASEGGARFCTWGGTLANPTGRVTITPGVTNIPSTEPLNLFATGELTGGGRCTGTMTFRGIVEAGGSCPYLVFKGKVQGVPGIASFYGPGALGVVHEFLYDKDGNVVGSDQPQVFTVENSTDPDASPVSACRSPEGFTGGAFSSTVELYA